MATANAANANSQNKRVTKQMDKYESANSNNR